MGIKLCPLSPLTAGPMPSKSILSCASPPRPWLYLFWLSDATADVLSTRPFLFILPGLRWIPLPSPLSLSLSLSLCLSAAPSLDLACLSCVWQDFTCSISCLYCPRSSFMTKKKGGKKEEESTPLFPKCANAGLFFFLSRVCSDIGCHVAWVSMVWRVLLGPGALMRSMLH